MNPAQWILFCHQRHPVSPAQLITQTERQKTGNCGENPLVTFPFPVATYIFITSVPSND